MFPTKCKGQNDRMGRPVISCFCQNLDFSIGFATKISNFTLPPPFHFLCLINSFYKRCVFCIYPVHWIQYIQEILLIQRRKLTLNDVSRYGKLRKLTLNDVSRYGKLRKLTVNYVTRYGKLRKQVFRKRQNSKRGFRYLPPNRWEFTS